MNNLWVKFGCFLTGYNYTIVRNSSEATAKAVKKYLSALLIVSALWAFIGYAFTQRYLHGHLAASLSGGLLMMFIVIQIERQIILSVGRNKWTFAFRVVIGIVMAIIGSIILDQVIFKDDVEKSKIDELQHQINNTLSQKTQQLNEQILQLNQSINSKENERSKIIDDISKSPMIASISTSLSQEKDSATKRMVTKGKHVITQSIPNPKVDLIPQIDVQLKALRSQKTQKENEVLNARQMLERDLDSKVGFLDELKILFSILLSSLIALLVWVLIFFFFLAIELFVLFNKYADGKNDYDKTILHQMEIRIKMLEKLMKQTKLTE